jgi:hypothetical protein
MFKGHLSGHLSQPMPLGTLSLSLIFVFPLSAAAATYSDINHKPWLSLFSSPPILSRSSQCQPDLGVPEAEPLRPGVLRAVFRHPKFFFPWRGF